MGERVSACTILIGKTERKRQLGKPGRGGEDSIKMDLQELDGGVDWTDLTQDRTKWQAFMKMVMNLHTMGGILNCLRTCRLLKDSVLWS
jgi:hypothetical protein